MTAALFPELAPRFRTILMDPPWPERGGGQVKRGADRHYDLLDQPGARTVPVILRVVRESPLWRPFPDASHLYMWCTDNYLPAGLWLIGELGFRYVRTFVWVKTGRHAEVSGGDEIGDASLRDGIGQYARGQHELLLFAVCGKGMSELVYQSRRDVGSVIMSPHEYAEAGGRIHSRKPDKSYARIEARSKGPYAEIFGRRQLPGWEAWGNELAEEPAPTEPAPRHTIPGWGYGSPA